MNAPVDFKVIAAMFQRDYEQIEVKFDPEYGVAWTFLKPSGVPCFNPEILEELRAHDSAIEMNGGRVLYEGELRQIRYHVGASKVKNVFNLGGDLALFVQLIKSHDRDALMRYARSCVDSIYARICNYNSPLITISLVQGEALGGGFESALSSNVIIAERGARMGFPEILFNLFPGMGAYSLLARRVGVKLAEKIILSGRVYTAEELFEMGVVDMLAEDGTGETAVREYIRRNERHSNGMQAVFSCRQHLNPISHEELLNITNLWVDAALRLEEKDLKMMSRLARSQFTRIEGGAAAAVPKTTRMPEELRYAIA
jgi:DSF synthase